MNGRAELIVAEPIKGDHGIARIDQATMNYIGVKPGDDVDVHGILFTPAQTRIRVEMALPIDDGMGIIRIASNIMDEGRFRPGMTVIVERSWLETLRLSLRYSNKRKAMIEIKAPNIVTAEEEIQIEVPEIAPGEEVRIREKKRKRR